ncbi:hypothetical protein BG006_009988 [Podila minutissima]|uniref:DNA damage-binding protein CMR1 n=1 Tax=Podila minutissima TaxID=64525 RepID=A0A9P5ST65_9FUNG|nr:hypothetical protein BG006_009988 [Podila minutissima]
MKTRRQEVKEEHKDDEKHNLKADDASDNDESSTHAGGLTDYERQRLENIRRNQEAMQMFNLPAAASAVSRPDRNKRSAPTVGVKREKRTKTTEHLPRRTSNRLANIAPDGPAAKQKSDDYKENANRYDMPDRTRRGGDLSLADVNAHGDSAKFAKLAQEIAATYVPEKARMYDAEDQDDDDNDNSTVIKKEEDDDKSVVKKEEDDDTPKTGIKKYFSRAVKKNNTSTAADDKSKVSHATKSTASSKHPCLRKQVQSLKLRGPWPTVKVCQGRVYCMAIHQNRDKILVCGGDIDGNLGFWDLDESHADDYEPELEEEPNVYSYKAHSRSLSSMQYSPTDPTKLFSTSYDGSVRYLDLVKQQFLEAYVVPRDVNEHLGSISIDSTGNHLWFADSDGGVSLKDVRTPKDQLVYRKMLHEKKVGCVNVNPKHTHLIATSSLDRTMRIWDVRNFASHKEETDEPLEELAQFPHRLSVTSAMWSPDGNSIVSTSYDDYVRVFNNFEPGLPVVKEIPEPIKIPHNNQSGRWCTMLRAVWSHQFNWFTIGNMNKSLDIYSRGTGDLMANLKDPRILTTVPAANAWHPSRIVLASGMANGKMVIWR